MKHVSFNFKTFLVNAIQEQTTKLSGSNTNLTFPVKQTKDYDVLRADDLIEKQVGASYLPRMGSVMINKHLLVVINTTWDRNIPWHVTKAFIAYEKARYLPEASQHSGVELHKFCDQIAMALEGKAYKEAVMFVHERFPGTIKLERIEALLDNGEKPSLGFKIAKCLLGA